MIFLITGRLQHFLDGCENECKRRTELMAHVREELYLHQVEFMHAMCFPPLLLYGELHTFTLLDEATCHEQDAQHGKEIQHECCRSFPEGRQHGNVQRNSFVTP